MIDDNDDDLARQAKILEMQLAALSIGNAALRDEIQHLEGELVRDRLKKRISGFKLSMMSFIMMAIDMAPMVCKFL